MEYKEKHALFITVNKCIQAKKYAEAIGYFGRFPHLLEDSEVKAKKEEVMSEYKKQQAQLYSSTVAEVEKDMAKLVKEKEEEDRQKQLDREQRQKQERGHEMEKVKAMLTAGDLVDAFNYYQKNFPQELKNKETQRIFEKICNELIQPDLAKANGLLTEKKFAQSEKCLQQVPEEYRTRRWQDLLKEIYLRSSEDCENKGDIKQAIQILEHGSRIFPNSAELGTKLAQLESLLSKGGSIAQLESLLSKGISIAQLESLLSQGGSIAFLAQAQENSKDLRYWVSPQRVIYDTQTGLEWYEGPDHDITWDEGKKWVENLTVDGNGWRMPTLEELRGICTKEENNNSLYLDPVFKTKAWWVWSNELCDSNGKPDKNRNSPCVRSFYFRYGHYYWSDRPYSYNNRMFAVRRGRRG